MTTALLIIDVQVGLTNEAHDAQTLLQRTASLIDRARGQGAPVIYVQHDDPPGHPLAPGTPPWQIQPAVAPAAAEPVIRKRTADAFYETPLHEVLQSRGVRHLVVAGCQTEYCIDTTCRRAVSLNYSVTLAGDAHSTGASPLLSAAQIIAHHNYVLHGFGTAAHMVRVRPAAEIQFE